MPPIVPTEWSLAIELSEQNAGRVRNEADAPHRLCYKAIYQCVYYAEEQSAHIARVLPERCGKRKAGPDRSGIKRAK